MGAGCMENVDSLTKAETKRIYRLVWKSLRDRPENWGPLITNNTVRNVLAGLEVKIVEQDWRRFVRISELVGNGHTGRCLVTEQSSWPFNAKGQILGWMHVLRHKTNAWQVSFIEEAIAKDRGPTMPARGENLKRLPTSITDQFTKTPELVESK